MSPPRILASLRSADPARLDEQIARLEAAGIDGYHVDVMDGRLVPESCLGAEDVRRLRPKTSKLIDVHLLCESPERLLEAHAQAGADRIAFHREAVPDPGPLLDRLRELGVGAGLVAFPSTPLAELEPWLDRVDLVNPLGVDPRVGGGFQESTYTRVAELRQLREDQKLEFVLQADGGVWAETREGLVAAGAEELVGGYPIFSAEDFSAAVRALREG